jgi:hypothetical protein
MQKRKFKSFQRPQIELAFIQHFPYCPPKDKAIIVARVQNRNWDKKTSLTQAISISVHNYIRHHLTDYEELLKNRGLTRDEARLVVKAEVDDWFDYWHTGNDIAKPDPNL